MTSESMYYKNNILYKNKAHEERKLCPIHAFPIQREKTYSVDLPAEENNSAQCGPSVFLAKLTTTSKYSGKFLIKSQSR